MSESAGDKESCTDSGGSFTLCRCHKGGAATEVWGEVRQTTATPPRNCCNLFLMIRTPPPQPSAHKLRCLQFLMFVPHAAPPPPVYNPPAPPHTPAARPSLSSLDLSSLSYERFDTRVTVGPNCAAPISECMVTSSLFSHKNGPRRIRHTCVPARHI